MPDSEVTCCESCRLARSRDRADPGLDPEPSMTLGKAAAALAFIAFALALGFLVAHVVIP